MEKLFYPAIFHTAEEGGFWITFPDLPENAASSLNLICLLIKNARTPKL